MIEFRRVDATFSEAWNKFVETHSGGTLFHTWNWLKILEKEQRSEGFQYGIFRNSELIGIFPFFLKRYLFLRVSASPLVVENSPYMGPLIETMYLKQAMSALDGLLRNLGTSFTRIFMRQWSDPNCFQNLQYDVIYKHTHVLDFAKSENELWRGLEGRCRTAIRKATKVGVKIETATDKSAIDEYYQIKKELYRRQRKATPNSRDFFCMLWDNFYPDNITTYLAKYEGKIIAGAVIAKYKDTAYYLDGVSIKKYNELCPNNLIQWEALRAAKADHLRFYDFVGSDLPWLAKFKKSFGGELCVYLCLEKSSSAWVKIIRERILPEYKKVLGRITTILEA